MLQQMEYPTWCNALALPDNKPWWVGIGLLCHGLRFERPRRQLRNTGSVVVPEGWTSVS
ncbi:MAG: hypothetical protein OEV34_16620 [Gammaproteobacteria bacterium]|nr:hypothetical protein [Gammaproteobacteria bacterium]